MATLGLDDFRTPARGGDFAGESRDAIFNLKIKKGRKFTLGKSAGGKKVDGIFYNTKTRELTYQLGKKSIIAKYTKIFKDADFGGGSGSGGGATDTKYTESLQCFYNAHVFNVAKTHPCKSVSPKQLADASSYAHTDVTLKDCLAKGPADWIESDVYLKTANKMYASLKFKTGKKVHFHRGSTFMNNVYEAKKTCHANDKKSDSPQAPGTFSNDKWNPGDIWATTLSASDKPLHKFTDSWGQLNGELLRLAGNGNKRNIELLGVSLKKIGANANARLQEYSSPEMIASRPTYKWEGYNYGKTGDFFNSQDIYVRISGKDVQFRTFGGDKGWQGEIKGVSAAGGKIGGGNVNFYVDKVFSKGIYGSKTAEKTYLAEVKRNTFNIEQKLYDGYIKHRVKQTNAKPEISQTEFYEELSKQDDNFKNSKLLCLNFLDAVMDGSIAKRNELATYLFRYASSDTDQSSYFVKLY